MDIISACAASGFRPGSPWARSSCRSASSSPRGRRLIADRPGRRTSSSASTQALDRTRDDLVRVKESIREKMGQDSSFIFEAHLLILEDPTLLGGLEAHHPGREGPGRMGPVQGQQPVRAALRIAHRRVLPPEEVRRLGRPDADLPEPRGRGGRRRRRPQQQHILVAHELLPSEAALRLSTRADPRRRPGHGRADVAYGHPGPVHEHPGRPRPAGCHAQVREGDFVIVDGTDGEVIINPPAGRAPRVPGQEGEVRELPPGAPEDGQAQVGDPRPRPVRPPGQHRAPRGGRAGPVHRRGRRRPLPLGVHLSPRRRPCRPRRTTLRSTPASPGGPHPHPVYHPDPRHRRRKVPAPV